MAHALIFRQAIGTRVLGKTTHLLDGVKDVNMSKDMFLRSILPIGLLFSASLILSNTAYLYLSVAYIQMLKAFVPVAILLISWTFRIQDPNKRLAMIVLMISSGVALASRGELRFNLVGFVVQAAAVVVSAFPYFFISRICIFCGPRSPRLAAIALRSDISGGPRKSGSTGLLS